MRSQHLLLPTQHEFVHSQYKHPLFLGGYGSGKSHAMVAAGRFKAQICVDYEHWARYGPMISAQYEPTYTMISDILIPEWEKQLLKSKQRYFIKRSAPPHIDLFYSGNRRHRILLRSMERPDNIVGANLAFADVDELDKLNPKHANLAWDNINARVRVGPWQQVGSVTTPEGLKWTYETWERKKPNHHYKIYRASTVDNPHVSDEYIQGMLDRYGEKAKMAFIDGKFVDLHGDTVIDSFDQIKHVYEYKKYNPHYPLGYYTGIDFGWAHPTVILGAQFDGEHLHIYDELILSKSRIDKTIERWQRSHKKSVFDFCDPAGNQNHENAPMTNIQIMRAKGMNPRFTSGISILEGVQIINNLLDKGILSISPKCIKLIEALKFHSWEHDKFGNFKGPAEKYKDEIDALRYLCWHIFGREITSWK